MGRTFCVGDIHGNYRGLIQAIERSPFDRDRDRLITIGDYIDGGKHIEVAEVISYLSALPDWIGILGNHDQWMIEAIDNKVSESVYPIPEIWYQQGGQATLFQLKGEVSYCGVNGRIFKGEIPHEYQEFFSSLKLFHAQDDMCFCHAGWEPITRPIERSSSFILNQHEIYWSRRFWEDAQYVCCTEYEKVFIGHTQYLGKPVKRRNVWNLDTGAGYTGQITVMDVHSEEYWQSDYAMDLYENFGFRQ